MIGSLSRNFARATTSLTRRLQPGAHRARGDRVRTPRRRRPGALRGRRPVRGSFQALARRRTGAQPGRGHPDRRPSFRRAARRPQRRGPRKEPCLHPRAARRARGVRPGRALPREPGGRRDPSQPAAL
jgi:hypothetical protein